MPLDTDLQEKKTSLPEFEKITIQILDYLPNVLSTPKIKNDYQIYASQIAGTTKYVRPLNSKLFISKSSEFKKKYNQFLKVLKKLPVKTNTYTSTEKNLINSVLYTIQQSIGAGLDLLVNPNSARKHVGNRFEELIKCVFDQMKIMNKKITLKIPYGTGTEKKNYKCENDLLLSPHAIVRSTSKTLDKDEIVVSIKTTSKDRMGKMFIDKMLLERFVKHDQKVVGIFLNDVQRMKSNNISFTLVSGLFMVYTQFLTKIEGVYYLDPPPNTKRDPYNKHMHPFSDFVTKDIWDLLSS